MDLTQIKKILFKILGFKKSFSFQGKKLSRDHTVSNWQKWAKSQMHYRGSGDWVLYPVYDSG